MGRGAQGSYRTDRMTDIQKLSQWNRDISRAIAALGSDTFFPTLIQAIQGQVKFDYPQVWVFHRDLPPRILYHEIPDHAFHSQVDLYLEGPYSEEERLIVGFPEKTVGPREGLRVAPIGVWFGHGPPVGFVKVRG